jgi:hypothetical protein
VAPGRRRYAPQLNATSPPDVKPLQDTASRPAASADTVSGVLREVDIDPHHDSDLEGLRNAGAGSDSGCADDLDSGDDLADITSRHRIAL